MTHTAILLAPLVRGHTLDTVELDRRVRAGLSDAADRLVAMGMPRPRLAGKLLRPTVAYLGLPVAHRLGVDERFWFGALAIQMAHEASLIHDDVIDGAAVRRGEPTVVARRGVGYAVVAGDHLLTSAYRAASLTGSLRFMTLFAEAVEGTVSGEIDQVTSRGRILNMGEYRGIVTGKTGRLFGCALSSASAILGLEDTDPVYAVGERVGVFYQMLDDYLDLCTSAETGKEPLQDYRGQAWTWPMGELPLENFEVPEEDIAAALFAPERSGTAPMDRALIRLRHEAAKLESDLMRVVPQGDRLARMIHGWAESAARARALEATGSSHSTASRAELTEKANALGGPNEWKEYFGRNSRSFRFASRLFPAEHRDRVTEVYAFCRFTDDLVDERPGESPARIKQDLDAWLTLAREAYEGRTTGVELLDRTMGSMAERGVPFHFAHELIEGMRMDLTPRTYADMDDLGTYTYRVASVVGGWLTQLFGRQDPLLLARASSLGHAMQLTNILRDVGEDLRNGRVYLPQDVLARHGLTVQDLWEMERNRRVTPAYMALVEELMVEAEGEYASAFEAIPGLPPFFQRPVAVAAHVYRGIHDAIRQNHYDNLTRRARTGTLGKVRLALRALFDLRNTPAWGPEPITMPRWLSLATPERAEF